MNNIILQQGNCLELLPHVSDESVDLILSDLPQQETGNKWDKLLNLHDLFVEYRRIIKPDGCIALFGSFKFGMKLYEAAPDLQKYEWVWEKENGTNVPSSHYQPFRVHEQIQIFGKGRVSPGTRTPMNYNPQKTSGKPYIALSGTRKEGWKGTLNNIVTDNRDGSRLPRSIQFFTRDKNKFHPTQKPVSLCEQMIKTYTNEGGVVLDNCMGSGTTGVASVKCNRNFIGIELDEKYFKIAKTRINEEVKRHDCSS